MKYYVYKTTFIEDGRFYVGVRQSSDIESDPYLGSGRIITNIGMFGKYGENSANFKLTNKQKLSIIDMFEVEGKTRKEIYCLYKDIVSESLIKKIIQKREKIKENLNAYK